VAHILVVDDDDDIRLLLRIELSAEGHHISEAGHGQAALDALRDAPPDLVLLDIMMPVLDGWGVLRALAGTDAPPIVVVTALATDDQHHVIELLELGAIDVIRKPFDPGWVIGLSDAVLLVEPSEREEYRQRRLARARARRP
jgi:DNA-binding response OmpR family regulator